MASTEPFLFSDLKLDVQLSNLGLFHIMSFRALVWWLFLDKNVLIYIIMKKDIQTANQTSFIREEDF